MYRIPTVHKLTAIIEPRGIRTQDLSSYVIRLPQPLDQSKKCVERERERESERVKDRETERYGK